MIDPKSPNNQLDLFVDRMYDREDMRKAFEAGGTHKIRLLGEDKVPEFDTWIKLLG